MKNGLLCEILFNPPTAVCAMESSVEADFLNLQRLFVPAPVFQVSIFTGGLNFRALVAGDKAITSCQEETWTTLAPIHMNNSTGYSITSSSLYFVSDQIFFFLFSPHLARERSSALLTCLGHHHTTVLVSIIFSI